MKERLTATASGGAHRQRAGIGGVRQSAGTHLQRFRSADQVQRVLSAHAMIYGHFRPRGDLVVEAGCRPACAKAFRIWRQQTGVRQAT
jgi:hypothetical protein